MGGFSLQFMLSTAIMPQALHCNSRNIQFFYSQDICSK